jgi:Protein of unknown function (DUF3175)
MFRFPWPVRSALDRYLASGAPGAQRAKLGTAFAGAPAMASKRKRIASTARRSGNAQRSSNARRSGKWSAGVTQKSDALDLEASIFTSGSPERIAKSLKQSAEASTRRKGTPYQSAMSMLNFYINRAGANLPARRKQTLEEAKGELRKAFGRT